jgi:hypothetical protein
MSIMSLATAPVALGRLLRSALASSVALLTAASLSAPASADVVWTLNNVRFEDGGAASGTFTVDTAGYFLNGSVISVTTTAGSTLPGDTYSDPPYNAFIDPGSGDNVVTILSATQPAYYASITLDFEFPLNVPRAVNPIVGGSPGPSWECVGWSCPTSGTIRYVGTDGWGSAAVPEPSTWALMALGFAGLGFAGWRACRKTAPAVV